MSRFLDTDNENYATDVPSKNGGVCNRKQRRRIYDYGIENSFQTFEQVAHFRRAKKLAWVWWNLAGGEDE
ncbi:hypothetical protein GCM10010212_06130 [Paenarthrobacter nicotinovorans]|nr:hypothetical protein GCM10010212_06130 [Paenarthrobacter nicotinovorans]